MGIDGHTHTHTHTELDNISVILAYRLVGEMLLTLPDKKQKLQLLHAALINRMPEMTV